MTDKPVKKTDLMTEAERDAYHAEKMKKKREARNKILATKTQEKGLLIVHTGKGKGKSTAAFGMVFRALGHGFKVGVVQFVKGVWETGERDVLLKFPELVTINEGRPDPHGAIAVIAPGTGLGEAFLVWDGHHHRAYPSEGGHASFSPRTEIQRELLAYLEIHLDHVSFERVCSGKGLPNIYHFLKNSNRYSEPAWLHQELAAATDPTPIIVKAALDERAEICVAALDLFVSILGVEAGNMALKLLATGGVYLGGGIPPRILPQLQNGNFMASFVNTGRFSSQFERFPVHVLIDSQAALHGAAYHGLEMIQRW